MGEREMYTKKTETGPMDIQPGEEEKLKMMEQSHAPNESNRHETQMQHPHKHESPKE